MIRVVLDTNIIVSAILQPLGLPARVFLLATGGLIEFFVNDGVYSEYDEVIRRPRMQRNPEAIAGALHTIRTRAVWVKTTESVTAASDPDDNIFLECAEAAEAHYLVTGNIKDFPAVWQTTHIVTAREFLEIFRTS